MARSIKEQLKSRYDDFYRFEKSRGKSPYQANQIAYRMSQIITFDRHEDLENHPVLLESFVSFEKKNNYKYSDEQSVKYGDEFLTNYRNINKRQYAGIKRYLVSDGESEQRADQLAKGFINYRVAFPEDKEKVSEPLKTKYIQIANMINNYHNNAPARFKRITY